MDTLKKYIEKNYCQNNNVENVSYRFNKVVSGIKAIKYQVGRIGKVFAFYGKPMAPKPDGGYPAVLLIHGGLGYAYYEWVEKWTERGYVAIAPDYDSHFAVDEEHRQEENPCGGPKGYGSALETESENPWIYFSVLSSMNAIDIICGDGDVDKSKIAIEGISWGGVIGLKLLSVDQRIKVASIKYSAAFISETTWGQGTCLKGLSAEQVSVYNKYFDPQNDLRKITTPILFAAGTDDPCFMMNIRKKTTDAVASSVKAFGYRLHYAHGHFEGWETSESIDFADSVLKGSKIARLNLAESSDGKVVVKPDVNVSDLTLCYSKCDFYATEKCEWEEMAVENEFTLPKGVCAYFITYIADSKTHYSTDIFVK